METIYRKVAVKERLPEIKDNYFCLVSGYSKMICHSDLFKNYEGITHWFEEIDLTQLQKDKEELIEMLESIQNTTPDKALIYEIESLIQKLKQ